LSLSVVFANARVDNTLVSVDVWNAVASDPTPKTLCRRLSSEDSALIVKCIPDEYCSIVQLKKHFAKYGVTRVVVNPRQHSATVTFSSHVNTIIVECADVICIISFSVTLPAQISAMLD